MVCPEVQQEQRVEFQRQQRQTQQQQRDEHEYGAGGGEFAKITIKRYDRRDDVRQIMYAKLSNKEE